MSHTATPWVCAQSSNEGIFHIDQAGSNGGQIATCWSIGENNGSDAAFIVKAVNAHDDLVAALEKIERWFGEFPETGDFWDKERTRPMSYAASFGSNGERDYMRCVAREALAKAGAL